MREMLGLVGAMLFALGAQAADSDADGIDDAIDNCTLQANAGQEDDDRDGYGNWCDPDLDQSGVVLIGDFARFRACWRAQELGAPVNPACDFDASGVLTVRDLRVLSAYLGGRNGTKPGPSALTP